MFFYEMPIYFCTWHILKVWRLWSMEKIKDNEVCHEIVDGFHAIIYMPIDLIENIDVFKFHGKNNIIESLTQHLAGDF